MKKKYSYLFIMVFMITLGKVYGQDIIRLKNGDSIKVSILQMDYINVYYKKWQDTNSEILSLNNMKVEEVIFEEYSEFILDSLTIASEIRLGLISDNVKEFSKGNGKFKKLGIKLNVFPVIDLSVNIDITTKANLEVGAGVGYIYSGLKLFKKDSNVKIRNYAGLYIYRFSFFSEITPGIAFSIGRSARYKNGFNLRIELGAMMTSNLILPLPKIGAGFRF